MTKQKRWPSATVRPANQKAEAAEHVIPLTQGALLAATAAAADKSDSVRAGPVAPPPDRAPDTVADRSPDRDTAPAYFDSTIDAVRQPLVVLDEAGCVVLANRAYYLTFNAEPAAVVGLPFASQFDNPAMERCLKRLRRDSGTIEDVEIEIDHPLLGRRSLQLSARRLRDASAPASQILLAIDDVTERNRINHNLALAKSQAERANRGKSRFLAAASHDLRQPLQTLSLLQGILLKRIKDPTSLRLIARVDETLGAMSNMLNTLLDINQLEAGIVQPEVSEFPIADLLGRLHDDFAGMANSKKLGWHSVPSSLAVRSDPRLLEQILRNLLSNALKYTIRGKILFGCRRRGDMLRIEVWDTGIGIPEHQLQAVFEEFYQLDNPARDRRLGIGLGLSILQRLASLLDHPIDVRSRADVGSMFAVSVPIAQLSPAERLALGRAGPEQVAPRTGEILIVEDDPSVREMLVVLFEQEGHRTVAAADGHEAFALAARGTLRPDVVVADYNLPLGLTGIQVATALRATLHDEVPVIILTGDISSDTLREIAQQNCLYLHKPVKAADLTRLTGSLMASSRATGSAAQTTAVASAPGPTVFVIDDDASIRQTMGEMLQECGYVVQTYASSEAFLESCQRDCTGCLVVDARLPKLNGIDLIGKMKEAGTQIPAIMITGHGDIPMVVEAMKAGAVDFLEKPVRPADLLTSIDRALVRASSPNRSPSAQAAGERLAGLTVRQQQVLDHVIAGQANKEIAAQLGISQRTVENHRAAVMKRTKATSLPDLIRLVMHAG